MSNKFGGNTVMKWIATVLLFFAVAVSFGFCEPNKIFVAYVTENNGTEHTLLNAKIDSRYQAFGISIGDSWEGVGFEKIRNITLGNATGKQTRGAQVTLSDGTVLEASLQTDRITGTDSATRARTSIDLHNVSNIHFNHDGKTIKIALDGTLYYDTKLQHSITDQTAFVKTEERSVFSPGRTNPVAAYIVDSQGVGHVILNPRTYDRRHYIELKRGDTFLEYGFDKIKSVQFKGIMSGHYELAHLILNDGTGVDGYAPVKWVNQFGHTQWWDMFGIDKLTDSYLDITYGQIRFLAFSNNPEALIASNGGQLNSPTAYFSGKGFISGTVNDNNVNIRHKPNLHGKILGMVGKGTNVTVLGRTKTKMSIGGQSHYWYKIRLESGAQAYIYGEFLDLNRRQLDAVLSSSQSGNLIVDEAKALKLGYKVFKSSNPQERINIMKDPKAQKIVQDLLNAASK